MRRVHCEHCRTEADLTEYGTLPAGWVTLALAGPPYLPPIDLCGILCARLKLAVLDALRSEGVA